MSIKVSAHKVLDITLFHLTQHIPLMGRQNGMEVLFVTRYQDGIPGSNIFHQVSPKISTLLKLQIKVQAL